MININDFVVRCKNCSREHLIFADSLEVSFAYDERPMGTETQCVFCGEMKCRCGRELSYTITAVEYPIGAYDFHICESSGCDYIIKPVAEVEYILEPVIAIYEEILQNPEYVYSLEPWEFEELVAEVFEKHGYEAEVTQKTRDGGKDIVAQFEKGGVKFTTYFECKKYAPNRPVGVSVVRELSAVMDRDRIDKGVIVTTSSFTKDAVNEADSLNGRITLIDYDKLLELMS